MPARSTASIAPFRATFPSAAPTITKVRTVAGTSRLNVSAAAVLPRDEALGVTSETTCKETCELFDVYCGVNSKGETECTSRYEMSDEYWTCYCGPEDQVLCGDSCTTSGAHGKRMSIVIGMMVSGVTTGVALLL